MSDPLAAAPATVARLDATVALARSLAQGLETDAAARLAELEARRHELDVEIARTRAGRGTPPLSPEEAADLRALLADTADGLRAGLQAHGSRAVADALLSPARRDAIGAALARVGLDGAHHAWLAAAEPAPDDVAAAEPVEPEDLGDDVLDDAVEVGTVPAVTGTTARPLATAVRQALRRRREQPLADALAEQPLEGGLAELVGWLALADDAVDVLVDDDTHDVTWTDPTGRDRTATVPRVRYRRAGAPLATPTRETAR